MSQRQQPKPFNASERQYSPYTHGVTRERKSLIAGVGVLIFTVILAGVPAHATASSAKAKLKNYPPVCDGGFQLNASGDECVATPSHGPVLDPYSTSYVDISASAGLGPDYDQQALPGAAVWAGTMKAIAPLPAGSPVYCEMLGDWVYIADTQQGGGIWCALWFSTEPDQEFTPPPPCWDAATNDCPVGSALAFAVPKYAVVGVPVTMYAYASWKPDANSPSRPTDATANVRMNGQTYHGVTFHNGVASWRYIPKKASIRITATDVTPLGTSGASAPFDTVPASITVLPYNPAAFAMALTKKRLFQRDNRDYTIVDRAQAGGALAKRLKWRVPQGSEDVCAVYKTKRGAVRLKFIRDAFAGKDKATCSVLWQDPKTGHAGKYTYRVTLVGPPP